jgi:hypothetical protein
MVFYLGQFLSMVAGIVAPQSNPSAVCDGQIRKRVFREFEFREQAPVVSERPDECSPSL